MTNSFRLCPNSDLPEWPRLPPGPDLDAAIAKLQRETPWPHCQSSDNISYRRLILEIIFPYYQDLLGIPVTEKRTIPWVSCVCPKTLPVHVRVEITNGPWTLGMGRYPSRNAFINIVPESPE